jgi:hypothetical protein
VGGVRSIPLASFLAEFGGQLFSVPLGKPDGGPGEVLNQRGYTFWQVAFGQGEVDAGVFLFVSVAVYERPVGSSPI